TPVAAAAPVSPAALVKPVPATATSTTPSAPMTAAVASPKPAPSARTLAAVAPSAALASSSARNPRTSRRTDRVVDADLDLLPPTPAPATSDTGTLNLDTTPWSIVTLGGK